MPFTSAVKVGGFLAVEAMEKIEKIHLFAHTPNLDWY